jgi:hypothetical protein
MDGSSQGDGAALFSRALVSISDEIVRQIKTLA